MNEFKFECPACGQHIGRDLAPASRVIPCPFCKTELRLPKPPGVNMGRLPKAQRVQEAARPPCRLRKDAGRVSAQRSRRS